MNVTRYLALCVAVTIIAACTEHEFGYEKPSEQLS